MARRCGSWRLTAGGRRLVDRPRRAGQVVPPTGGAQRLVRRLLDAGIAQPVPGPSALTTADVAVVVPTHDDAAALARTLATIGSVGHVVVVDDGSTDADAVAEVARAHVADLVRHDRSHGPGAARDAGGVLTASPVVAFVDADVEVAAGWLEALLAHLNDPSVAAVADQRRRSPLAARAGLDGA